MNVSFGRLFALATAAACGALAGSALATRAAVPPRSERVTPVLHAELADIPGHGVTAVVVDYAPRGTSLPHHHAGSVFAYVLSGAIRSQNSATGPVRVYHAGEAFFEPAGSVHRISANARADAPARLLAVFVAPDGTRLTTPEHGRE